MIRYGNKSTNSLACYFLQVSGENESIGTSIKHSSDEMKTSSDLNKDTFHLNIKLGIPYGTFFIYCSHENLLFTALVLTTLSLNSFYTVP